MDITLLEKMRPILEKVLNLANINVPLQIDDDYSSFSGNIFGVLPNDVVLNFNLIDAKQSKVRISYYLYLMNEGKPSRYSNYIGCDICFSPEKSDAKIIKDLFRRLGVVSTKDFIQRLLEKKSKDIEEKNKKDLLTSELKKTLPLIEDRFYADELEYFFKYPNSSTAVLSISSDRDAIHIYTPNKKGNIHDQYEFKSKFCIEFCKHFAKFLEKEGLVQS